MLSETRLRSIFALVISRRQVWAVIATLTSSVVCSYVSSSRSLFSCQERKSQAQVKGRSCAVASARRVLLPMPSLCKVSGHCRQAACCHLAMAVDESRLKLLVAAVLTSSVMK